MEPILFILSTWLHAVATAILIGFYLLLSLIHLPAFKEHLADPAVLSVLRETSRRSRLWLYLALGLFFLTGFYLMLVDPNYLGIGRFGNAWSLLMLVKHLLILGMLGLGFWYNGLVRIGSQLSSESGASQAFSQLSAYSKWMAILGVLVLLLTAVSQTL